MLKMQTFEVVRHHLRPILQRALFVQQPPSDLSNYFDLLTEAEQSSAGSPDFVVHFTFPSRPARALGENWGLYTPIGKGPEPTAALRALTADVVSLCPIPVPAWQRYTLESILEPAAKHWSMTIERLSKWVEGGKPGEYRVLPSLLLIDPPKSPRLVELGEIQVSPTELMQGLPEELETASVTLHYLRRPFLAGPVARSANGQRILEGLLTDQGIEFPRKLGSKRTIVQWDMAALVRDITAAKVSEDRENSAG